MSRIVGPSDTTNDTFYPSLNFSYLSTPKRWSLSQHQRMIYVQQNVLKRQKNRTRNITRIQEDSFLYYLLWIKFSLKSQDLKIIHPANFSPLCSRTHYTQEKCSERSFIWLPGSWPVYLWPGNLEMQPRISLNGERDSGTTSIYPSTTERITLPKWWWFPFWVSFYFKSIFSSHYSCTWRVTEMQIASTLRGTSL